MYTRQSSPADLILLIPQDGPEVRVPWSWKNTLKKPTTKPEIEINDTHNDRDKL